MANCGLDGPAEMADEVASEAVADGVDLKRQVPELAPVEAERP